MALRQQAFKSIRWNSVSTITVALGSLIQLYILVRYIEKSDFGLMALVNVVIAFAMIFLDFGFSSGVIYKKDITQQQLSTLFWFNILTGMLLAILVAFSSPLVAWFYETNELIPILRIIALGFIINSFAVQFQALLTKELQFDLLAIIKIISFLIAFFGAVILAVNGFGIYALVWGYLLKVSTSALLMLLFGRRFFRPDLYFKVQNIRFFLSFGSFQMGERFLNFFNKQIDVILIGKFLGAETLGVYDILKRFLLRPVNLINPVITSFSFPLMAKIQEKSEKVSAIYMKQLNYIGSLNFPIYVFLIFNAGAVLQFMFGADWLQYELIFQLLAIYFIIYATGNPVGSLLLSKGRADMGFYWNLGVVLFTFLAISIGITGGIEGIVIALLTLQGMLFLPNYFLLVKKLIPVKFGVYIKNIWLPLLLAFLMGTCTFFTSRLCSFGLITELLILLMIGGIVYFTLSYRFNRPFIRDLLTLLKI